YQRLFSTLFRAQSIEVKINNTISNLPPGTTTRLNYTAHNLGADGTFQILAADNRSFISNVQPAVVTLASGASSDVTVDVTVPGGPADGTSVTLAVTATNTADTGITNSATQTLVTGGVVDNPPDCRTATVSLWPPNHKMVA